VRGIHRAEQHDRGVGIGPVGALRRLSDGEATVDHGQGKASLLMHECPTKASSDRVRSKINRKAKLKFVYLCTCRYLAALARVTAAKSGSKRPTPHSLTPRCWGSKVFDQRNEPRT